MEPVKLKSVEFGAVKVNDVKRWAFAAITDDEGTTATVEFPEAEEERRAVAIAEAVASLAGTAIPDESEIESLLGVDREQIRSDWVVRAAVGALRTAVTELQCRHAAIGMTEALGGRPRDRVRLYANLNRYLRDVLKRRTPEDFGQAAERAVEAGFKHLKTDPFDEVGRARTTDDVLEAASVGFERLAAMRSAAGPDVGLLVDCHGAFNVETAPMVAEELARLGVIFFEDPVPQRDGNVDDLGKIAEKVSIPVVAGGSTYGEDAFEELVKRGGVDIIMPDVQRCGGVAVAARAARAAAESGVQTSCHSPFGPLSLLASAHVEASTPAAFPLEHAVFENEWRADLIVPRERVEDGHFWFPGGNGLGATLNWDVVERHGWRWRV